MLRLSRHIITVLSLFLLTFITNEIYSQSVANYSVTRSTGNTYYSIINTGTPFSSWRNNGTYIEDDNRSYQHDIGFDFWYNGTRYTKFSVSTNGYIDFSNSTADGGPTTGPYGYVNSQFSTTGGTLLALAPMYDDMTTQGATDPLGRSIRYEVSGTAPYRVLTVEWFNMAVYGNTTPDLNFQVKLYETTGIIEFIYGNMVNGTASFSYTCGINAATMSNPPTSSQLLTQQTANSTNFSHSPQNSLSIIPESFSKLTFTPPVPANPTGILTFTSITPSSMTLNWSDWASNEVGYAIYYSTDGVNYSFLAQTAANAVNYNATGLTPSTLYYWRVFAVTEGCLSAPLTGSQSTSSAGNKVSTKTGNWNDATAWSPAGVPTSTDNVLIKDGHTITINTNVNCLNLTVGEGSSGSLIIGNNNTQRIIDVYGNINISSNANFSVNINSNTTHSLNCYGNIINNGTLNFAPDANSFCNVTFLKNGNQLISGTGSATRFNQIILNMGTSKNNTLEITSSSFSANTNFLVLTKGTFKFSSPGSITITPFTGNYTINSNSGLWMNSANSIMNIPVNLTVEGDLTLSNGTINIGDAADENLISGGGQITITGGNLNIAGRLDRTYGTTLTKLNISGGVLTVPTIGSTSTTNAPIHIDVVGSIFIMSGGTIIIPRSGGNNLGIILAQGTSSITGGTIQIGNSSTPTSNIVSINSEVPFANLTINSSNVTVALQKRLVLLENLTINSGTLTTNNYNITIGGNWLNNGTFNRGTSLITFNGSGTQYITRTGNETFSKVRINKNSGIVVLQCNVNITDSLYLTKGIMNTGDYVLTLGTGISTPGILSYTDGRINGYFRRWITSTGNEILFPVGTLNYNRKVKIKFNSLTSGTLRINFNETNPGSNGLPLIDAGKQIVDTYSEGYWTFVASDGLSSNNFDVTFTCEGFTSSPILSSSRIIKRTGSTNPWTLNGNHQIGEVPDVKRTSLTSINGDYAIGKPSCTIFSATQISGDFDVCVNEAGIVYSVTGTEGNTYSWNVSGGTIVNGQGTPQITVNWGNNGGYGVINVVETNDCNDNNQPVSSEVIIHPFPIENISGLSTVREYQTGVAYSVNNVSGYSYTWSVVGGTIASGQNTSSITVNWGAVGSGMVSVTVTRICGNPETKTLNVSIVGPIYSVNSGNWTSTSTWVGGIIPSANDYVIISAGHTVTMNGNPGQCASLKIQGTAQWTNPYTTNVGNGGIEITSTGNITGTVAGIITTSGGLICNNNLTSDNVTIVIQNRDGQIISGNGSIGKLTINSITTNSGNITVRSELNGNSTLIQGNGSTLSFGGSSIGISYLDASSYPNTIAYIGNSFQNIRNITYHHLSFSGSGTKSLTNNLTINGNLTLTSTTLDVSTNNYSINLKGNWVNNSGTFNPRYGVVILSGSNQTIFKNGGEVFYSLSVSSTGTVTLNSPVTTTNLNLVTGKIISTNSNLITVSGTTSSSITGGSASSYVSGPIAITLPPSLSSGTTYNFPIGKSSYRPLSLVNPTTNSGGNVVMRCEVFDGNSEGIPANDICELRTDRYWYLTILSGSSNFTNTQIRLTESQLLEGNLVTYSSTRNGTYTSIGGIYGTSYITSNTTTSIGYYVVGKGIKPSVFNVTGSNTCEDVGSIIGLSGSQQYVSYQLKLDGNNVGNPIAGTGNPISFGTKTSPGTYTVVANTTYGCSTPQNGSVVIYPLPQLYSVTGGGIYCLGGEGLPVGLNGSQVGINYQLKLNGNNIGMPLSGTGNPISFGNQTQEGVYTVLATNQTTGCSRNMNGFATITIATSTTWTGAVNSNWHNPSNWDRGIPTSLADATIPAVSNLPEINSAAYVQNLTINPRAGLIINSTGSLAVSGDLTLKSPENDGITGSIIDFGSLTVTGTIRVERTLTKDRWWYVSSPVSNATTAVFNAGDPNAGFFYYTESNNTYTRINNNTTPLTVMRGYAVKYKPEYTGNMTFVYTGTLNTGEKQINLTGGGSGNGWNLVGNPYPSSIDWDSENGWERNNIGEQICYRTNSIWATYNKNSGIGTNGGTRYIPPLQGFWVKSLTSSSTLKVNNQARVLRPNDVFFRERSENNILRINAVRGNFVDESVVAFMDGASDNYDAFDTDKFFSTDPNYPQVYFKNSGKTLVSNVFSKLKSSIIIPLGLRVVEEGKYAFVFENVDLFDSDVEIYLEDVWLNKIQNLREKPTYEFYSYPYNDDTRFRLQFLKNNPLPVELLSFTAKKVKNSVETNWITLSETNNKLFELQRSNDGINFMTIATIQGKGTINEKTEYTYTDYYPEKGINYYRLKQIDYNGNFTYSKIVSVELSEENQISTVGNPYYFDNAIYIPLKNFSEESIVAEVFDVTGKIIYTNKVTASDLIVLKLKEIVSGKYIIRIISPTDIYVRTLFVESQ